MGWCVRCDERSTGAQQFRTADWLLAQYLYFFLVVPLMKREGDEEFGWSVDVSLLGVLFNSSSSIVAVGLGFDKSEYDRGPGTEDCFVFAQG